MRPHTTHDTVNFFNVLYHIWRYSNVFWTLGRILYAISASYKRLARPSKYIEKRLLDVIDVSEMFHYKTSMYVFGYVIGKHILMQISGYINQSIPMTTNCPSHKAVRFRPCPTVFLTSKLTIRQIDRDKLLFSFEVFLLLL